MASGFSMEATAKQQNVRTDYYNKLAGAYDRQWKSYTQHTLNKLLSYLPASLEGKKVLDWGCGTGELIKKLLIRYPELAQVTGYDPAGEMLRQASSKVAQLPVEKEQKVRLLHQPQFDTKFDLIVSSSVFHYLPQPKKTLLQFKSLLHQQGMLVILDYTKSSLVARYFEWAIKRIDPIHQQAYQGHQIRKMVEGAGFYPMQEETFRVSSLWKAYVVRASNSRPI